MKLYKSKSDYLASKNSIVDTLDLDSLLVELNLEKKLKLKDAWISLGGWQSWNPSFEIEPGKAQPSLHCHLIKQWNRYLEFPCSKYKPTKKVSSKISKELISCAQLVNKLDDKMMKIYNT